MRFGQKGGEAVVGASFQTESLIEKLDRLETARAAEDDRLQLSEELEQRAKDIHQLRIQRRMTTRSQERLDALDVEIREIKDVLAHAIDVTECRSCKRRITKHQAYEQAGMCQACHAHAVAGTSPPAPTLQPISITQHLPGH